VTQARLWSPRQMEEEKKKNKVDNLKQKECRNKNRKTIK
jgi:hypothetical protein